MNGSLFAANPSALGQSPLGRLAVRPRNSLRDFSDTVLPIAVSFQSKWKLPVKLLELAAKNSTGLRGSEQFASRRFCNYKIDRKKIARIRYAVTYRGPKILEGPRQPCNSIAILFRSTENSRNMFVRPAGWTIWPFLFIKI